MRLKIPSKKTVVIDHAECGSVIRRLRESKNKSLRWLAHQMQITAPFLSDLERGRRNWSESRFFHAKQILTKI